MKSLIWTSAYWIVGVVLISPSKQPLTTRVSTEWCDHPLHTWNKTRQRASFGYKMGQCGVLLTALGITWMVIFLINWLDRSLTISPNPPLGSLSITGIVYICWFVTNRGGGDQIMWVCRYVCVSLNPAVHYIYNTTQLCEKCCKCAETEMCKTIIPRFDIPQETSPCPYQPYDSCLCLDMPDESSSWLTTGICYR